MTTVADKYADATGLTTNWLRSVGAKFDGDSPEFDCRFELDSGFSLRLDWMDNTATGELYQVEDLWPPLRIRTRGQVRLLAALHGFALKE